MSALHEILGYYGMPEENIESAVEQIAETYGACRYLDGGKGRRGGGKRIRRTKAMRDNYEHIHHATNSRLAEMLEHIGLDLGASGNLEACAIIGEVARRLRIPPHRTFYEEYFGEV